MISTIYRTELKTAPSPGTYGEPLEENSKHVIDCSNKQANGLLSTHSRLTNAWHMKNLPTISQVDAVGYCPAGFPQMSPSNGILGLHCCCTPIF